MERGDPHRRSTKGLDVSGGGQYSTIVNRLASAPSCPRFNSQHSQNYFRGKIINIAEVNQRHCLEESGQRFENVDRNPSSTG